MTNSSFAGGGGGGGENDMLLYVGKVALIIVLVLSSGLFSGLTLGLMGLDPVMLEVVIGGGDERQAQ